METQVTGDGAGGRHIAALDGIRGLALLLVLADHLLWSNINTTMPAWVNMILALHSAGWIGVDLFFVLSGFLITGILHDTLAAPHYFRNFYARRALRIFPLYYGFLLVLFVLSYPAGGHWYPSTLNYLTYTENIILRRAPTDAWWINISHFWSLAIEEQFYLVWPLLVFLLKRRDAIAMAALAGAAFSLGVRLWLWHSPAVAANPYLLYSWTPARLDGLLSGAFTAMVIRSRYRDYVFRAARPLLLLGSVALLLFYLRYPGFPFDLFPVVAVWVPALLAVTFSALIVCALRAGGALNRAMSTQTLRFFGRYSYGLYVFHFTVASILAPLRTPLRNLTHSRGIAVLTVAALALAGSTALAWLSFRFYEQPWLRLKKHFENSARRYSETLLERTAEAEAVPER